MKKNILSKGVAKAVVLTLDMFLHADANSTSCCFIYQPKTPKELEKFRRKK